MRDYGKISTSIWDSRKFGAINDDARFLYFYLHTCKFVNSVGCYILKEGYALVDLGWSSKRYRNGIKTLCEAHLIGFDTEESLIRIVGFLRFDPFSNPKHAAGACKIAMALPDCEEKLNLFIDLSGEKHAQKNEDIKNTIDTLSKRYRNPEPEPEPEPEEREAKASLSSDDDPADDTPEAIDEISEAVDAYRKVAARQGWPDIHTLTKARRASLAARLKEAGGIQGWLTALDKAAASSLCNGRNDRGWVANFDFLTRQSSFSKLMEGNYDDRRTQSSTTPHTTDGLISLAAGINRA